MTKQEWQKQVDDAVKMHWELKAAEDAIYSQVQSRKQKAAKVQDVILYGVLIGLVLFMGAYQFLIG